MLIGHIVSRNLEDVSFPFSIPKLHIDTRYVPKNKIQNSGYWRIIDSYNNVIHCLSIIENIWQTCII